MNIGIFDHKLGQDALINAAAGDGQGDPLADVFGRLPGGGCTSHSPGNLGHEGMLVPDGEVGRGLSERLDPGSHHDLLRAPFRADSRRSHEVQSRRSLRPGWPRASNRGRPPLATGGRAPRSPGIDKRFPAHPLSGLACRQNRAAPPRAIPGAMLNATTSVSSVRTPGIAWGVHEQDPASGGMIRLMVRDVNCGCRLRC